MRRKLFIANTCEDNQKTTEDIKVVMALGFHLYPSRTEKLSPITPMVLRNSGRVGSRRFREKRAVPEEGTALFFVYTALKYSPRSLLGAVVRRKTKL